MAGKYISKFSGVEIDTAIEKALLFNPDENGWIHVYTSADLPVSLDSINVPGNFIIDYFTDAPEELLKYSPINLCVVEKDGEIIQYSVIMDNVFMRKYDGVTNQYGEWIQKKTTNYIYVDEEPTEPTENTLMIGKNTEGIYTLQVYNGTKFVEVAPPDIMVGSIYDTTGRAVDFFDYVDECFQQMTNSCIGMMWVNQDITDHAGSKVTCYRMTNYFGTYVAFANSSRIMELNEDLVTSYPLPVTMVNPQIVIVVDEENDPFYKKVILYDIGSDNPIFYITYDFDTWTTVDLSDKLVTHIYGKTVGSADTDETSPYMVRLSDGTYGTITLTGEVASDVTPYALPDYVIETFYDMYMDNLFIVHGEIYEGRDGLVLVNDNKREVELMAHNIEMSSLSFDEIINLDITAMIYWIWVEDEATGEYTKTPFFEFKTYDPSIDETTVVSTEVSKTDPYVVLTNFKEFFGNYCGYAVTASGRVDSIQILSDPMGLDAPTLRITRIYQSPSTMDWLFGVYSTIALRFITYSDSVTSLLSTSQDDNILMAVEDHISNIDIHFSEAERQVLYTRETKENVEVKFNRITTHNKEYIDGRLDETIAAGDTLQTDFDELEADYQTHIADMVMHTTEEERSVWAAKAEGDHEHNLDGKVTINASQVVEGVFDIARIPNGAKERIIKVDSIEDRNKLTVEDVQIGDRIAVKGDSIYEVTDESLLAHTDENGDLLLAVDEAFYESSAGTGAFIDWVNVENKPTTVAGYGIEDTYTKDETNSVIDEKIAAETERLEERYGTYDLESLYETVVETEENIAITKGEVEAAILVAEEVAITHDELSTLVARVNQLGEDVSEMQSVVDELLLLYA